MSSDPVIEVRRLGKRFRISRRQARHQTLRDSFMENVTAPARKMWSLLRGGASAAKGRHDFWAIRDVSFDARRGEVLGVVGRNGSGKSTLLKILSRITPPTEGAAIVRGRVGSLLEVGTGFHFELSGRENILLSGVLMGMPRRHVETKFDEIVEFAQIGDYLDTPVKRYSSGMYTRLAFSVAAHLESDILLVDEVLAVGDHGFQQKCLAKMRQMTASGRTVLFVSHNTASLEQLCDRAILLAGGTLEAAGETTEVVQRYLGRGWNADGRGWVCPSIPPTSPPRLAGHT